MVAVSMLGILWKILENCQGQGWGGSWKTQKSLLRRAWKGNGPQQPGARELHPCEKKENTNLGEPGHSVGDPGPVAGPWGPAAGETSSDLTSASPARGEDLLGPIVWPRAV